MPKPKPDESHDDFIERCIPIVLEEETAEDEKQAYAICESYWEEAQKEKNKTKDETFNCECIECSHQMTSEEHCKDLKCPECGGTMRRTERPGPGEDATDNKKAEPVGLKVVKNAKEKSADIWIYQNIGTGWFDGFSAKEFADEVKKLGKIDIINVYLNSAGGNVFDGVAIYNILQRNKARVIVQIDALAASIASVIAMAGDEIRMAENALMMIHNPWGFVIGDVNDFAKAIEDLNKVKENSIMPAYQKQSGMEEKEIAKLMDAETWMSAAEAKEYGFIDEISEGKEIAAHIDRDKYRNVFRNMPEKIETEAKIKPQEKKKANKNSVKLNHWQERLNKRAKFR